MKNLQKEIQKNSRKQLIKVFRKQIIEHIVKTHKIQEVDAIGIVDYEKELHIIDSMIEEDLYKKRKHDIPSMAKHIMQNDEGQYQLDLLKEK